MLRKANPVMRTFNRSDRELESYINPPNTNMSITGTLNKTFYLLMLAIIADYFAWQYCSAHPQSTRVLVWTGLLLGAAVAFLISFKPNLAPTLSTFYALLKGVFLGAVSFRFESRFPGVVVQAVGLTLAILAAMVFLYRFNLIRVTGKFKKAVVLATFGVMIFYIVSIIAWYFFDHRFALNAIHNPTWISFGFSFFVIALASFNLVLDFQFIEKGARKGLPKYMEWYGSFGLMVTIVWLYIESLKLMAKLQNRN